MGKIAISCSWCGNEIFRYPSAIGKHAFCSSDCRSKFLSKQHNPDGYIKHQHLSEFNLKVNPSRMTMETRQKLRAFHLGKGEGKAYPKIYGQHAHRVTAEQVLGRPLEPGEVVHHKDGDKLNFSPDNLIVFSSQEEHAKHHLEIEKIIYGTVMGREVMPK